MKTLIWISIIAIACFISFSVGYGSGFAEGANYAIQKGISAIDMMFDVQLSGKAKNMIMGFPDIMLRIDQDTKDKLGLNSTEYQEEQFRKLNETLTMLVNSRYPKYDIS